MPLLGVEIGGTKLQVGLCDARGQLLDARRANVNRRAGAAGIRAQLRSLLPPLLAQAQVQAIGVGFGGPVDAERGRTICSHQIRGWDRFDLRGWFEQQFDRPTVMLNDQDCAAYAEATLGAGRGQHTVFYVTVGTGIGAGLVIDGQLHTGRFGAAEIGHTKLLHAGRWRTVESLAAGLAIERGVSTVPQAARILGLALANAITLLNPDVVIVGGGVATAGPRFWRPLRQSVARHVFPVYRRNYRLLPAQLGQDVVLIGAALWAGRMGR